jgi:hypothetical protein
VLADWGETLFIDGKLSGRLLTGDLAASLPR